jgi:integrase
MPTAEGEYRVWLSESEQDALASYYADDLVRQVSIRLMLHGLRSDEVTRVARSHIRRLDAEDEAYKLRVPEGKTGYRETPLRASLRTQLVALSGAQGTRGGRADAPVADVTTRTLARWVDEAADALAEETGEENWQHVSCHDLRRSWATTTYYRLHASDVAKSLLMRWGGWSDEETFEQNYLGREPDDLAAELMGEAGLA